MEAYFFFILQLCRPDQERMVYFRLQGIPELCKAINLRLCCIRFQLLQGSFLKSGSWSTYGQKTSSEQAQHTFFKLNHYWPQAKELQIEGGYLLRSYFWLELSSLECSVGSNFQIKVSIYCILHFRRPTCYYRRFIL